MGLPQARLAVTGGGSGGTGVARSPRTPARIPGPRSAARCVAGRARTPRTMADGGPGHPSAEPAFRSASATARIDGRRSASARHTA